MKRSYAIRQRARLKTILHRAMIVIEKFAHACSPNSDSQNSND